MNVVEIIDYDRIRTGRRTAVHLAVVDLTEVVGRMLVDDASGIILDIEVIGDRDREVVAGLLWADGYLRRTAPGRAGLRHAPWWLRSRAAEAEAVREGGPVAGDAEAAVVLGVDPAVVAAW